MTVYLHPCDAGRSNLAGEIDVLRHMPNLLVICLRSLLDCPHYYYRAFR